VVRLTESGIVVFRAKAMVGSGGRSSKQLRRDRGATLVEAAVVFPLLFLVLLALVEFGMAFKDSLSIGHGAREAARAGATFGNDPYANILVLREIEDVMDPVGIADGLRVRIYDAEAGGLSDEYVFQDGYAFGCDWFPCPDPDAGSFYAPPNWLPTTRDVEIPDTDLLGVRVTFTHRWLTKLFATSSDFTKEVEFQIEPQVFEVGFEP
jgi:hypothetical protein